MNTCPEKFQILRIVKFIYFFSQSNLETITNNTNIFKKRLNPTIIFGVSFSLLTTFDGYQKEHFSFGHSKLQISTLSFHLTTVFHEWKNRCFICSKRMLMVLCFVHFRCLLYVSLLKSHNMKPQRMETLYHLQEFQIIKYLFFVSNGVRFPLIVQIIFHIWFNN